MSYFRIGKTGREGTIIQISELSEKTGVSIRSIRYYEEKGLVHPIRLNNGYREFDKIDINRVETIQVYLKLGLNTNDISRILSCPTSMTDDNKMCATKAISLYEKKYEEIINQIDLLKMTKSHLEDQLIKWRKIKGFPTQTMESQR